MNGTRGSSGRLVASAALLTLLAGCNSCRNDHPFVPYSIGEAGAPSRVPSAGEASVSPAEGPLAPSGAPEGTVAPPATTTWRAEGLELKAPDGRFFEHGLFADLDGDGQKDALCVLRRFAEPTGFDLLFYPGISPGSPVVLASPDLAIPSSAPPAHRLLKVGKRAFFAEVTVRGTGALTETRFVLVADLAAPVKGRPPEVRTKLSATVVDPVSAPRLGLEVDGADRDGDGVEDLVLRLTLAGGGAPFEPGPPLSLKLAWLDRPAGLSRDPDEPRASLSALAKEAVARAGRPREAAAVPPYTAQLRALIRAACPEAGSPRLVNVTGVGLQSCGAQAALEDASLAEVRAHVALGDPLRAAAAFDRWRPPFASRSPEKLRQAEKALEGLAQEVAPRGVLVASAVPLISRALAPGWGPLAFTASGELDILTRAGVLRFDPITESERESAVAPWKPGVLSPDGAHRFLEVFDACKGVALHATFAPTGDSDSKDLLVPVSPPLGRVCKTSRGELAEVVPVAWGPRGLEALVQGEPVLFSPDLARVTPEVSFLDQPVNVGSPRSPGGRSLAIASSQGVLLRTPSGWRRVKGEALGPPSELSHCTASDDGARIACVHRGKVKVALLP